jgi:hypothetical protein
MGNGEAWSNRSKDGRLPFPRLLDKKVRTKEIEKTAIFRTPERVNQEKVCVLFLKRTIFCSFHDLLWHDPKPKPI